MSVPTTKILVAGHMGSGKTTFVKTLSEIKAITTDREAHSPEERSIKSSITVAFDFGTVHGSTGKVCIYGVPGQKRFSFMWEILAKGTAGYIFMLDSTNSQLWTDTIEQIKMFIELNPAPFILVANKQDLEGAMTPEVIREELGVPEFIPIVPCVAVDRAQTLNAMRILIEIICAQRQLENTAV